MHIPGQDDLSEFLDNSVVSTIEDDILEHSQPWRILIVDDDKTTHVATIYALERMSFRQRRFEFISAYNSEQAYSILRDTADIALVILDIIMETADAGLRLIERIRNDLNNQLVRIVLRTGQPGLSPEHRIVVEFDIDDYKNKTELGGGKLFTMVVCALRTYDNLYTLLETQKALGSSLKKIQNLESALNQHAICLILDHDGFIEAVNDKFCALSRYAESQLLGKHIDYLLTETDSALPLQEIWQDIKKRKHLARDDRLPDQGCHVILDQRQRSALLWTRTMHHWNMWSLPPMLPKQNWHNRKFSN